MKTSIQTAVLTEYDGDGFLGAGVDLYGDNPGMPTPEAHHPGGFFFRPRDPDPEGGATPSRGPSVLRMSEGNVEYVLALGDPRATPKLGQHPKGTAVAYGDTGKAALPMAIFAGDTGSFTLTVPYGDGSGAATLVYDASAKSITLRLANGVAVTLDTAAGTATIRNAAGNAKVEVGPLGVSSQAPATTLGAPVGDPSTVPAARSLELIAFAAMVTAFAGNVAGVCNTLLPGSITAPVPVLAGTVASTTTFVK